MKNVVAITMFLLAESLAVYSQDSTGTSGRAAGSQNQIQLVSNSQTQNASPLVGGYIFLQRTTLWPCDLFGNLDKSRQPILSLTNQKFTVMRDLDGFVLITIDEYPKDSKLKSLYNGPGSYFYIQTIMLNICAVKNLRIKGSLAFGIINFPFKYRTLKHYNDFSGSFNFGAALGVNLGHYSWNKWGFTLLTSYSISNINLDSVSVQQNASKLTTTNNYTAFSFAVGCMISYDKVQAGVFIGTDILSRVNQATFDWRYQGSPWISVGFGYSIFAGSKTVEGEGGN
jgi:hypothetical protein